MTDYEKYVQLFTETGVNFQASDCDIIIDVPWNVEENPLVDGYAGFKNIFQFDIDTGKLLKFLIIE